MTDFQKEPGLSSEAWCERFVARMMQALPRFDGTAEELRQYATEAAPTYEPDRADYVDPEEAAETDVGYWEAG